MGHLRASTPARARCRCRRISASHRPRPEDLIEVSELIESLFGPRALEFPELGLILTAAEVDKSCAAGLGSSNESLSITEPEVDEWFADCLGSCAGSSAFHATLGA